MAPAVGKCIPRSGRNCTCFPEASWLVGLGGLEPPTPRLSSVCSNQLSYRPCFLSLVLAGNRCTADRCGRERLGARCSRKEEIQPHLPLRLPCYDFHPFLKLTVVG